MLTRLSDFPLRHAGIILACLSCLSQAETLTLQASADTSLWEADPDFNFGAQTEIVAGSLGSMVGQARSRILLQFDIASQLPPGAQIQSAQLRVTVVKTPPGGASSTFALHRVLLPWTEGASSGPLPGGSQASNGETTWKSRKHGTVEWSIPGGAIGVDFDSQVSGTATIVSNGTYNIELTARGIDDLDAMRNSPLENYGWVLRSQSESIGKTARRFAARENNSNAPSLNITYELSLPFDVPLLEQGFDHNEEEIVLRIASQSGAIYRLEHALVPYGSDWTPLSSTTSDSNGPLEMRASTLGLTTAFFRITGTLPEP